MKTRAGSILVAFVVVLGLNGSVVVADDYLGIPGFPPIIEPPSITQVGEEVHDESIDMVESPGGCGGCDECETRCGSSYYFLGAAGTIYQDRDPFRCGRTADDPRISSTMGSAETFDTTAWAPAFDFIIGKEYNECWAAEGRFGFAFFEEDDHDSFTGSGENGPKYSYFVPSLDGGPGGIRFRDSANMAFDYESDWYDFGVDLIRHTSDHSCGKDVDYVFGVAVANISQDCRSGVTGFDGESEIRAAFADENIDEWFYGMKIGRRSRKQVSCHCSFISEFNTYLYYHDAEYDGVQSMGGYGGDYDGMTSASAHDEVDDFVTRLELRAGFECKPRECVTLGVYYQIGAWLNASQLDTADIEWDDNEWQPTQSTRLASEDFLTHSVMATITCRK